MIDRSLCPLCLCGSFHPLALEKCILEYILPTKPRRADLLEELLQIKTSKEQLTFSVYKLVKTLNRPEVYAGVATVIIEQISKLYSDIAAAYDTQLSSLEPAVNPRFTAVNNAVNNEEDNSLRRVVNSLENHLEAERMQKLMFAAYKKC
ncbi:MULTISPECIES: hypothetical protein [Microcystis]|jgi:hypothetical protein|uniref:hypothetical protein n=1 Tax=Microcystis TaxID=1125 RepID=UPI00086C7BCD|nr:MULTISPECIES: hypothetical protein [Microcystis]MDB9386215.1 hypothetical protein [Microcystis aeruginosa CS-583]ODV36763.1 Cell division trigger factor [Microcystis aeruginosa NIES-98]WOB66543.1 hypothetical protein PJW00_12885 [Microcystis aeruginosa LE3]